MKRYQIILENFVISSLPTFLVGETDDLSAAEASVSDLCYLVNHQTKVVLRDVHEGKDTSFFAHQFSSQR